MNRSHFAALVLCLTPLSLSSLLFGPIGIAAQAIPAGARKAVDLSVYGGYLNSEPDYAPYRNTGEAFGVNISRRMFHFPITPSLEVRVNLTNGPAVKERTYLPGFRGTATFFHILHPYAAFLIGPGDIHFNFSNNGYQGDNSVVYCTGGGVDFDVASNFQVMADFQYQHWNFGRDDTLTPTLFLFGVSYHIPFRPYNARRVR